MKRFLLVFLGVGLVLLIYGVVRSADPKGKAGAADATASQSAEQQKAHLDKEYQRLVGPDGDYARTKEGVRRALVESDRELRQVLGGNSRRLIEKANQKPRLRSMRECASAASPKKPETPPSPPEAKVSNASPPPTAPDPPQTPIVRALLSTLDEQDPQKVPGPEETAPSTDSQKR